MIATTIDQMPPVETIGSSQYRLFTIANVPFGTFPAYSEGGPAMVVVDGWGTSYHTGGHIEGVELHAYRVPWTGERHDLHGTTYPTMEAANKAAYDAGLLAYMVRV